MSEAAQALRLLVGANSIFTGDKSLTTSNAGDNADTVLFASLGIVAMATPLRKNVWVEPVGIS